MCLRSLFLVNRSIGVEETSDLGFFSHSLSEFVGFSVTVQVEVDVDVAGALFELMKRARAA